MRPELSPALTALTLLLALLGPASAQTSFKLSAPITTPATVEGDVQEMRMAPDGRHVVYLADQDENDVMELYSAPLDRSTPAVKLNGPLAGGGNVRQFQISPDGRRVVFLADPEGGWIVGLFSAPIDGSSPAVRLAPDGSYYSSFVFTPDAATVLFIFDGLALFRVPTDGSAPAIELFRAAPEDGLLDFLVRISPDGSRAVFLVRDEDLYSVPIGDPPSAVAHARRAPPPRAVKLSRPRPGERIWDFEVGGERVVYRYFLEGLYSAPLDGRDPPRQLSGALVPNGWVNAFELAPDGSRVLYVADQEVEDVRELYIVPADGSASAVKLNPPLVAGGDVEGIAFAPDGRTVVYSADQEVDNDVGVYTLPADGSASPTRVSAPLRSGEALESFQIAPDSRRVVYFTDRDCGERFDLFSVPVTGGGPLVKLNGEMSGYCHPEGDDEYRDFRFEISADGRRVVYLTDGDTDNVTELFSTPIDGGVSATRRALLAPRAGPVKLNAPLPLWGEVDPEEEGIGFLLRPDGLEVVYLASQETHNICELFAVPTDGRAAPRKLNPRLALGTTPGDVRGFTLAPDGTRAVYLTDRTVDEQVELHGVRLEPGTPPVELNAPLVSGGNVAAHALTPDGSTAVYVADQEQDGRFELFRVPSDGSSAPVRLNDPFLPGGSVRVDGDYYEGPRVAPDGARVVYYATPVAGGAVELFSVPLDGSSSPVRLDQNVSPWARIAPDGARVVYRADPDLDGIRELYSVPIDGSSAPVVLNVPQRAGVVFPDREGALISPDSTRVVYLADEQVTGLLEVYAVPIDGSSAPVKLSGAFIFGGRLSREQGSLKTDPSGQQVVYVAAQERREVYELFAAPIDGSTDPVKLSGPLSPSRDVMAPFEISADGRRVVYRTDTLLRFDVYSAPLDASLPPVRLNLARADADVNSFELSPDGSRVLYVADQAVDNRRELFAAPIDGSTPAIRLNLPLQYLGFVQPYRIDPDGTHAVYGAWYDSAFELHRVPLDGRTLRPLGGPFMANGAASGRLEFTPDGRTLVYLADQETDGVLELFAVSLAPQPAPSDRPR